MATVRPFKAVRPSQERAAEVAALPYDVMSSEEAREMVKGNPYSFLHVDKAEIDLDPSTNIYDDAVYLKAKETLEKFIAEGTLMTDSEPHFYIYKLTMDGREQTGLVACASIDEYLNGKIKKHELTLEAKEKDRIRHVETTNANTGPIFLAFKNKIEINEILANWTKTVAPVYDFTADDGIGHAIWDVNESGTIDKIVSLFEGVDSLYIADGHHRNASAVKVGLKKREAKGNFDGNEEFNFYLSVIFPDNHLKIFDYNRLVNSLNGLNENEFLAKVEESFDVEKIVGQECRPQKVQEFGMYLGGSWYKLTAKNVDDSLNPVDALDVSLLQNLLLTPILGIGDPRTDKNISFVGGIRGLGELKNRVDSGEWAVAFAMFPTSMEQLFNVADNNQIMPPKSTWFEPKLRSGLFVHYLD